MRLGGYAALAALVAVGACADLELAAPFVAPSPALKAPPVPRATLSTEPIATAMPAVSPAVSQAGTYVVRSGDTLSGIAQRLRVDMAQLARLNGIQPPYNIRAGQRLILPGALSMVANVSASPQTIQGQIEILSRSAAAMPLAVALEARYPLDAPVPEPGPRASPPVAGAPAVPLPAPPARAGSLVWPVRGQVVSTFGSKGGGIANDGIDIRAAAGLPVVAVDHGVVAFASNELKALGNLVLIQHAGGWVSAYANAGGIAVRKGQTVTRGQQVATTGQTGNAKITGLHFELRRGTEAVDPLKYLPASADAQVATR